MLSFLSATPALRVPVPMMQLQGVGAPVGVSAPAGGFVSTVVPTKTDSSIDLQKVRSYDYSSLTLDPKRCSKKV